MASNPPELPGLSEAELTLLKYLWDHGPATVRQVHQLVEADGRDWAYNTVQTMLTRVEEKGYVAVDRGGFAHVFEAAVTRQSLVGRRLDELREDLCDGALTPLLLHLTEGRKFSADEIAQFRGLLDQAERSGGKAGRTGKKRGGEA